MMSAIIPSLLILNIILKTIGVDSPDKKTKCYSYLTDNAHSLHCWKIQNKIIMITLYNKSAFSLNKAKSSKLYMTLVCLFGGINQLQSWRIFLGPWP